MEKEYYEIGFGDLVFRPGYNTTCRKGVKHYEALLKREIGCLIKLYDVNSPDKYRYGILRDFDMQRYCDLHRIEISSNHIARTPSDLREVMLECYPDFHPEEDVTIIGFDLI